MLDALLSGLTNSPNVHPVFVHFPVALWLVAAGAWLPAVAECQTIL